MLVTPSHADLSESGLRIPGLLLTQETVKNLILFAREEIPMLLIGETGTGKTTLAQTIHTMSKRNEGPFVTVNAANLRGNILESSIFGHIKGAYTGANYQRRGLLGTADKGTLFLDDAQAIDLSTQERLLRVMETGRFRQLGDDLEKETDTRLIASFNKDPATLYKEGKLHLDFVSRLANTCTKLPALREMPEQFESAADCIMTQLGIPQGALSEEAMEKLREHPFMGNFRELKAVLQSAYILAGRQRIEQEHAMQALRSSLTTLLNLTAEPKNGGRAIDLGNMRTIGEIDNAASRAKEELIIRTLKETGSIVGVIRKIGGSERTVQRVLAQNDLATPEKNEVIISPDQVQSAVEALVECSGNVQQAAQKAKMSRKRFNEVLFSETVDQESTDTIRRVFQDIVNGSKTINEAAERAGIRPQGFKKYREYFGVKKVKDEATKLPLPTASNPPPRVLPAGHPREY